MKRRHAKIPATLAWLLFGILSLNAEVEWFEINVGTGGTSRSVNWNDRGGGGSWGVSSEAYAGFTLTSLINHTEGGELSWVNNLRTLGVGGAGSVGNAANINLSTDGTTRESIRLDLPPAQGAVGLSEGLFFKGLRQLAFDRLTNGGGSEVSISGFTMDPQAEWVVAPGIAATLVYNDGTLSFSTGATADGWADFGVLQLGHLEASLDPSGVSLFFSNNKGGNNGYGLVGWQYAASGDVAERVLYVATHGSDDHPGTSPDQPLRSLQRAADLARPGDRFVIAGGTYRETITLTQSGQPGQPIRFTAAPGERVVIDGADPVLSPWQPVGGGVWKTSIDADSQIEAVFSNGLMMMEARWPDLTWEENWNADKKWALTGEGSQMGLVYNQALAASGIDLTGGLVYIKLSKGNSCFSRPITSHTPGAPAFSWDASGVEGRAWSEDAMPERIATFGFINNRFFVVARGALDAPGEWWHDPETGELFFFSPDGANPSNHDVSYKARVTAFQGTGIANIILEGLEFRASNLELTNVDRCVIRQCHFIYSSTPREFPDEDTFMDLHRPVYLRGHDNWIDTCLFRWTTESPLEMAGTGNRITNSVIHDFNLHGRHPGPGIRLRGLASSQTASQEPNTALNNTVYNAGGVGLYAQGRWPANLSHNHVFNAGIYTVDIAALYVPNGSEMSGSEVSYNWIHDVNGIGFRVDIEGRGMRFHHNLVWNARSGAKMQGYWLEVYNNTLVVNNPTYPLMIVFEPDASPTERALWRVRNNVAYGFVDRKSLRWNYSATPRPTTIPLATVSGRIDTNVTISNGEEALLFAEPLSFDFRPRNGGPLDRTGITVSAIAERPDGQAPSIGALEPEAESLWRPGAEWLPDGRGVPSSALGATSLAEVLLEAYRAGPDDQALSLAIRPSAAGTISLTLNGPTRTDFLLQSSTDLLTWEDLELISPPSLPFIWNDTNASTTRFFRVLLPPGATPAAHHGFSAK